MQTNKTLAAFLVSDEVKMVGVKFEPVKEDGSAVHSSNRPKTYHYKTTMDLSIGDFVVVNTNNHDNHGYEVAQICELDVEVDFASSHHFKWICSKLDFALYDNLKEQERNMISKVRSAEKAKQREELAEAMFADMSEDEQKLLRITSEVPAEPKSE